MANEIDKALGVVEEVIKEVEVIGPTSRYPAELLNEGPSDDEIETDYKYQRENFYNLVEKGSTREDEET